MRVVEHHLGGTDKLLRIETDGCGVHVLIGLHDPDGNRFTAVQIDPQQPDDHGDICELRGPATTVLINRGPQHMAGDRQHAGANGTPKPLPTSIDIRSAPRARVRPGRVHPGGPARIRQPI
jgi:hypothetical protein